MTQKASANLAFPFRTAADGRLARVGSNADLIREELYQLLLTDPGERPNLPDFGGGTRRLLFEKADPVSLAVVKARITQAINRYLGHRLVLESLEISSEEERLNLEIRYRLAGEAHSRLLQLAQQGG